MDGELKAPDFICVDVGSVIRTLQSYPNNTSLYPKFPIPNIIQCLLHCSHYYDDEYVWRELDERFKNEDIQFDFDVLQIFFENLTHDIDSIIRGQVPAYVDTGEYVFHKWVSPTALVLQKDAK